MSGPAVALAFIRPCIKHVTEQEDEEMQENLYPLDTSSNSYLLLRLHLEVPFFSLLLCG